MPQRVKRPRGRGFEWRRRTGASCSCGVGVPRREALVRAASPGFLIGFAAFEAQLPILPRPVRVRRNAHSEVHRNRRTPCFHEHFHRSSIGQGRGVSSTRTASWPLGSCSDGASAHLVGPPGFARPHPPRETLPVARTPLEAALGVPLRDALLRVGAAGSLTQVSLGRQPGELRAELQTQWKR